MFFLLRIDKVVIAIMTCQLAWHIVISLFMSINSKEYLFVNVLDHDGFTSLVKLIEGTFWKSTMSLIDTVWYIKYTKLHISRWSILSSEKDSKRFNLLWRTIIHWTQCFLPSRCVESGSLNEYSLIAINYYFIIKYFIIIQAFDETNKLTLCVI